MPVHQYLYFEIISSSRSLQWFYQLPASLHFYNPRLIGRGYSAFKSSFEYVIWRWQLVRKVVCTPQPITKLG